MRVLFMGTPEFAVPTLEALIQEHEVIGVYTQPDKPKGRGKAMAFPPVKEKALEHNIPVFQPAKVRVPEVVAEIEAMNPDAIVVVAFGQILPESILNIPKYGCINVHASLLPKYRGAAPMQWAIIDGEKETGITTMYMAKGLDTGDMILKAVTPIGPKETGETLHDRMSVMGGPLIIETLKQIEAGTAPRTPQDDSLSCYAAMLDKELGCIDWKKDAASIERLIRGLNSWPSAYTFWNEKTLKIWDSEVVEYSGEEECGTVVVKDKFSFTVKCGEHALKILEVQLQGKKRMTAQAFLVGNQVETGMRLG
ncbi:MAG: methionyl-tRNA formyltransferase [Lachnospiraceae bacterium]|nr:methionyl-tRNA formyltransferase [Lachnospiraceae bacterium]